MAIELWTNGQTAPHGSSLSPFRANKESAHVYLPPFPRSTRVLAHLRGRYPLSYVPVVIYEVSQFPSPRTTLPSPALNLRPSESGRTNATAVQSVFLGSRARIEARSGNNQPPFEE